MTGVRNGASDVIRVMGLCSAGLILLGCLQANGASSPVQGHAKLSLSAVEGPANARSLWLAAQLDVDPGWHVYWENPGASGIATKLEWSTPKGYEIVSTWWPTPKVFEDGGIVNFGYEGRVAFLAKVAFPPGQRSAAKGVFGVKVDWMACKEACVLGSSKATLPVQAALRGKGKGPKVRIDWTRYPASIKVNAFKCWWVSGRATVVGEVPVPYPPSSAYFFPRDSDQFELESKQDIGFRNSKSGSIVEIRMTPVDRNKRSSQVGGVLVVWDSQNKETSYIVDASK